MKSFKSPNVELYSVSLIGKRVQVIMIGVIPLPSKVKSAHGECLGPILITYFTAGIPFTEGDTIIATFADETAILGADSILETASAKLQTPLRLMQDWFKSILKINSNHIHYET